MSTWLLIILFYPGTSSGMSIEVPSLPSLTECQRVYQEVIKVHPRFRTYEHYTKCIEVKGK